MRSPVAALAALLALAACSSDFGPTSAGSCVSPRVFAEPSSAHPGNTVVVRGEWFAANCPDTVLGGRVGRANPLTGLRLDAVQDGRSWTIASEVSASGPHQSFQRSVTLPAGLQGGPAIIRVAGYGLAAVVTVIR